MVFPESPAQERSFGSAEAALLVVSLLALGTVLTLLRQGFSIPLNTVWAEDGPIYLQGALTQGFWDAVFSPYAGYLVVVPRLIGELATLVPLDDAPAAISLLSGLFAAVSALVVWFASAGHIRNVYLRGALALATVLAPAAGQEVLVSAAYVPWYMLFASFWLLFWRPRGTSGAALGGLFLLATGLSTPGVWFFLPVAVLRTVTASDRRDLTIVGGYFLGGLVQIPVILGQEQGSPLWSSKIWTALPQRVVDGGLLGQRLGGGAWQELGWYFLAPFVALVLAGLLVGCLRSRPATRWFAGLAVLVALVMFILSVYQRTVGPNIFWSPGTSGGTASRYVLVPALLLLSACVVVVDDVVRGERGQRVAARWAVAATVGVMLVAIATSFDMTESGVRGRPYWDESLRAAADKCLAPGEELAGIATSPTPFGVQIPCGEVASYAGDGVK